MVNKVLFLMSVLFVVAGTAYGQGGYPPPQNGAAVVVNQGTYGPPNSPFPYNGGMADIGQHGIRESWVHEVRPLTRFEDATPYQASPYNTNGTSGWFYNQQTGCWQRDIPCQYTYPQNNYYVPQQYYNYCVPQQQLRSNYWNWCR